MDETVLEHQSWQLGFINALLTETENLSRLHST